MVVCMEHDEGVLDEGDRDERPEDEAEKAEEVVLGGVLQLHRREHVERRRPEVAVHDPQRLVRQPQRLEPRIKSGLKILVSGLNYVPGACGAPSCRTG